MSINKLIKEDYKTAYELTDILNDELIEAVIELKRERSKLRQMVKIQGAIIESNNMADKVIDGLEDLF